MQFLALSILFFSFAFSSPVNAREGANHGGVGSDLVSQFREVADRILGDRPPSNLDGTVFFHHWPIDSQERDEREMLRKAFRNCRVVAVPALLNPVTGKHIPKQKNFVAWGSPGLIQLKTVSSDPTEDSWENLVTRRRPIAHHIFHELYRCSGAVGPDGKTSPDDGYQLSVAKYHFEDLPILIGGDVVSLDCHAAYSLGRWYYRIPDSDSKIAFANHQAEGNQNTNELSYHIEASKTQAGLLINAYLQDKHSGISVLIKNVYYVNEITTTLADVKIPEMPQYEYIAGKRGNLSVTCQPNYAK
jgi:hypothetical protein